MDKNPGIGHVEPTETHVVDEEPKSNDFDENFGIQEHGLRYCDTDFMDCNDLYSPIWNYQIP